MYAKFLLYIWERSCAKLFLCTWGTFYVGYAKLLLYTWDKFCVPLYTWENFCVGVRKTYPIYRGILLSVGVRNFSTATPIYMGEILRRGAQNLCYIYGNKNLISVMLSITIYHMQVRHYLGSGEIIPQNKRHSFKRKCMTYSHSHWPGDQI